MTRLIILATVFVVFVSCDNTINGKITDNFGKPVDNVSISIINSGFSTVTKKDGSFKLDYVAGEFQVSFQKEGYLAFEKSLKIAENKKYPLGELEMIKLPKSEGIFFIDQDCYVAIPKFKLPYSETEAYNYYSGYSKTNKYFFPKDTTGLLLKVDTSTILKFFDNNPKSASLTRADNSRYMFSHSKGLLGGGSIMGYFYETESERIASGIRIIKFKPKDYNSAYSFVEITSNDFGNKIISGNGFCFKLEADTLQ